MKDDTLLHETSKNAWTNTRSTQIALLLHTLPKQSKETPFKYEQNKWQKMNKTTGNIWLDNNRRRREHTQQHQVGFFFFFLTWNGCNYTSHMALCCFAARLPCKNKVNKIKNEHDVPVFSCLCTRVLFFVFNPGQRWTWPSATQHPTASVPCRFWLWHGWECVTWGLWTAQTSCCSRRRGRRTAGRPCVCARASAG